MPVQSNQSQERLLHDDVHRSDVPRDDESVTKKSKKKVTIDAPAASVHQSVATSSNFRRSLTRKSTVLEGAKKAAFFALTCFIAVWYIFFYGLQTVLVKYINDHFQIFLVWYTAFLMSCGWPINLVVYTIMGGFKKNFRLKEKLVKYGPLSIVTFSNAAFSAYGLNYLPGSVYVLLKGTSIIFNVILSKLVLKKRMNWWHWLSVAIMVSAAVTIAFEPQSKATDYLPDFYAIGFALTLCSSLSRALQAILSSWWFKKTKKTMKNVVETTLFNGIFTNIILIPALFISGEVFTWGKIFQEVSDLGGNNLTIFVIVSVCIALAKQLEYLAKFAVVARVSALFEAVMDIFRRIIVIVIIVILFNEGFTVEKFISLALVVLGFIAYMQAGRVDLIRKKAEVLQQKLLADDPYATNVTNVTNLSQPRVFGEDDGDESVNPGKRFSFNVETPQSSTMQSENIGVGESLKRSFLGGAHSPRLVNARTPPGGADERNGN